MVLAQNHTIFGKFRSNAILVRICAIVSSEERIKILSTRYLLLSTFSTKKKRYGGLRMTGVGKVGKKNDKGWVCQSDTAFPAIPASPDFFVGTILPMFL